MRQKTRKPIDEMQVDQVKLDANSRDDIPQLLKKILGITIYFSQSDFAGTGSQDFRGHIS